MFITVYLGPHRPLDDKRVLVKAISDALVGALRISADDVLITLVPIPNENFPFGRGELQLADGPPRW